MNKKIRVIIADDSALMRKKISEILSADPDIEVVATVKDGKAAVEAVHEKKPDVVTLDVEMPFMDGIQALGYIMSEIPVPCVMISAYTVEGANETVRALELGAVDFVAKPGGVISFRMEDIASEILSKVKAAANVPISKLKLIWTEKRFKEPTVLKKPEVIKRVFAIASSTGGTQALATILPELSADIAASILVVQHMPEGFTKSLSERLNSQSEISIVEAEDNMLIRPAHVIIAKGGSHMEVSGTPDAPRISLNLKPPLLGVRPCANLMMETAVKVFGNKVTGIVLTGMGSDGTEGAKAIRSAGGTVIAQDENSCVVYGMPKSVVDTGLANITVPLGKIAEWMEEYVKRG